jgi:hypothetical protein
MYRDGPELSTQHDIARRGEIRSKNTYIENQAATPTFKKSREEKNNNALSHWWSSGENGGGMKRGDMKGRTVTRTKAGSSKSDRNTTCNVSKPHNNIKTWRGTTSKNAKGGELTLHRKKRRGKETASQREDDSFWNQKTKTVSVEAPLFSPSPFSHASSATTELKTRHLHIHKIRLHTRKHTYTHINTHATGKNKEVWRSQQQEESMGGQENDCFAPTG